ncbi:hypothetical protein ABIB40_003643 [Pedobacter sp. UYP30]|uniref:hypothetical protein n=1 Tax=Pedobacter sp. UYP30 TaxID=1756400 RepID=UPI0033935C24
MMSTFSTSTIFFLLGCFLLGGLYAWLLYTSKSGLKRKHNIGFAALRTLLVAIIAFLLVAPLLKFTQYTLQKPVIIIGQDNSTSIKQVEPNGFDQQAYQRNFKELQKKLSEKFDVQTYHFGAQIGKGLDFSYKAKLTDADAFLKKIKEEYINRNVGAVILATDGIFNKGANPLYGLQGLKSPVYTIALGDTIPKRDAVITSLNYSNIVYLNDSFTAEVQVKVFDGDGETAQLSLVYNGKVVQKQSVAVKGKAFVKTIPIKVKADRVGLQKFTIEIAPLKNEITTKNNSQTFYVEVIDGSQKVLLAAAAPHPDLAVLKEAISSNKHFEVTLALADKLNNIKLQGFDVIILYQLPDASNLYTTFISNLQAIRKPLWFILGGQTNLAGFNQMQNAVSLNLANGGLQEIYPVKGQNFTNFSLAQSDEKVISGLDPLLSPFGRLNVSANTTAVLDQRIGKIDTKLPLLFFANENDQKLGFLLGEGLWRWKLNEAQSVDSTGFVKDLISKTIQYLAVKDDKRRFRIVPSKPNYEESEEVYLNATLYNKSYQPINEPEVNLVLKNQQGKNFNYVFSKSALGYQLNIGNLPPGSYSFTGNTLLGKEKLLAIGGFYVTPLLAEYRQTTADHRLLNAMAQQSGGKMFMPKNLLQIVNEVSKNDNIKTVSYEDRRYVELINVKWLLALILALLSTEWFLRKRNGEV